MNEQTSRTISFECPFLVRGKVSPWMASVLFVALSWLPACGGEVDGEEKNDLDPVEDVAEPFALEMVSGDWQVGEAGEVLPDALVVKVVDEEGDGVGGHVMTFAMESAPADARGQSLSWAATMTDEAGEASVVLTLGSEPGEYVVTATAEDDLPGSPVTFTANVEEDDGLLEEVAGNNQEGVVTEVLAEAFEVRLLNEDGDAVEGVEVTFAITAAPKGSLLQELSATSPVTCDDGLASSVLTLGTKAGEYEVTATVESEPDSGSVGFTATAFAGEAFRLEAASGDGQARVVTETLENDLVARVVDEHGNPVSGHEVAFSVYQVPEGAAGYSISTEQAETGASGIASTSLTLGTKAGAYAIQAVATPELEGCPVVFVAIAVAGQAASLERVSGHGQTAPVREELDRPLLARALDQHGNVVRGHEVTFSIEGVPAGSSGEALSETSVVTGPGGLAETRLTLGTRAGTYRIRAAAPGSLTESSVLFLATAVAGEPAEMTAVDGGGQTAEVNAKLSKAMSVKLIDEYGNPVVGHPVSFAIDKTPQDAVGQSLSVTSTHASSDGEAFTVLTLGNRPGTYQVSATASGSLSDSPVVFTAVAVPGDAYAMERISEAALSGVVMRELDEEISVRVVDRAGNGVSGHTVAFFVDDPLATGHTFGDDSPVTDAEGRASTTFSPGSKVGEYVVRAGEEGDLVGSPIFFTVSAGPGEPFAVSKVSGCDERAEVTERMPEPFVVRVEDQYENPIFGHVVDFEITTEPAEATGQELVDTVSVTDEKGHAETTLKLGTRAGLYEVEAVAEGDLPQGSVTFSATAVGGDAVVLERISDEHQHAIVAEKLDEMVVRVVDSVGNGTADFPVTFEVHDAPEGDEPTWIERDEKTDVEGYARAVLKLGTIAGDYEVRASTDTSLSGSPMSFFATAKAGDAHEFDVDVSPSEKVRPGDLLDLSLRVVDEFGNTVEDWTGHVDVQLDTDPWGIAPVTVEIVESDEGEVTFAESISFSVADEEHLVSVAAGELTGLSLAVEVVPGDLENLRVQQETYGIDDTGTAWFTFALGSDWPAGGAIEIEMPEGYDLTAATLESVSGVEGSFSFSTSGDRTALITREGDAWTAAGTELAIVLGGVTNPPHGAEGLVTVSTLVEEARIVDVGRFYLRVWLHTSAGQEHTCGIDTEGRLWCWGAGRFGRLGDGEWGIHSESLPVEVTGGHTDWVAVSAGHQHTCGLRDAGDGEGGTLWCWGRNSSGELGTGSGARTTPTEVVGGHDDWIAVSTSNRHTCGIRSSGNSEAGTLWCWGLGSNGRLGDGNTFSSNEPVIVGENDDWLVVSAGGAHTCGIRATGTDGPGRMWCWGHAAYGQVGYGSTDETHVPAEVAGEDDDWIRVSTGDRHSCGVRAVEGGNEGRLWCWGEGADGKLGYGESNNRGVPQEVYYSYTDWVDVSAGWSHTCGLRSAGPQGRATAWCWGSGDHGRLGNHGFVEQSTPVAVHGEKSDFVDLSAGEEHTCGVRALGTGDGGILECWGTNDDGRLGLGLDQTDKEEPDALYMDRTLVAISAGQTQGCGIADDGTLWCWGYGRYGRLGNGDEHQRSTPWEVKGGFDDWLDVSTGWWHTCGIREAGEGEGGKMWCWGRGIYGCLGTGGSDDEHEPVETLGGWEDWNSVSAGMHHTCGIRSSGEQEGGTAWCWGRGFRGRLGDGTTNIRDEPTEVDGAHDDWLRISAGGSHTCGIRASGEGEGGTLWCWGEGSSGQLGNDETEATNPEPIQESWGFDDWVEVSAGDSHTCGIRATGSGSAGSLYCWGDGANGRLGFGSTENRPTPTPVFGESDEWVRVSSGVRHTCGIQESGSERSSWCWGSGDYGALGNGDDSQWLMPVLVAGGHSDWLEVSVGSNHTYGLRPDGAWSWGRNHYGQLGDGTVEKAEPYRVENPDLEASAEE